MSKNLVSVREFYAEHCVWQCLDNRTLDLDDAVFLGHSLTVVCY
ncbi:hypothetical protein ACFPRL_25200 [Pseudoclavibacter helvolus]